MSEVLRLAMRHGPRGVMRIAAEFPAEHAAEVARHAAAIADVSGAEWEIQTTKGKAVAVLFDEVVIEPTAPDPVVADPVVAPPVAPEPPPDPPKVSVLAGLWALIRGRQ